MATPPGLPEKIKRSLWRGDRRVWTHVFRDGPLETDPLTDLTGLTFTAQFRKDKNRGEIVCSSTCEVTGPGTVVETLTTVEADKLPGELEGEGPTRLFWDLQSTDTAGEVHTWLYADVPVKGDATDA